MFKKLNTQALNLFWSHYNMNLKDMHRRYKLTLH
jgi:hypothetical protein